MQRNHLDPSTVSEPFRLMLLELHWQPHKLRRCGKESRVKNVEWFVERLYVCIYQEAIERKEKRARRFHFCVEESSSQRTVLLDKDMMKKGRNSTVLMYSFIFFKPAVVCQVICLYL